MKDKPVVLFAPEGAKQHAEPIVRRLSDSTCEIRTDWNPTVALSGNPKLLVVFDEHGAELGFLIHEARRRGIATLQVMDGILEWRRTWEYPTSDLKRPLNQPAYADRIACLGNVDQRVLSAWGNAGRCIAIGAPRIDALTSAYNGMRRSLIGDRPRILVITAKTPYFNETQKAKVISAMSDLKYFFEARHDIDVVWRISHEVADMLGVRTNMSGVLTGSLVELLRKVDLVITTPSTSMLESMLAGLPTAVVDYTNSPSYVQSAWRITSSCQISECIDQMLDPTSAKELHQHFCLSEALNITPDATGRMADLITEMLKMHQENLLPLESIANNVDLSKYKMANRSDAYPAREIFKIDDVAVLQDHLESALAVNEMLGRRLAHIERRMNSVPGVALLRWLFRKSTKI